MDGRLDMGVHDICESVLERNQEPWKMAGKEVNVSNELLVHWIGELLADKESPAYATVSDIENNYLEANPGNCIQVLKSNSGTTSRICHKTNALPLVGYGADYDECRARLRAILNSLSPKENPHA